MESDYPMNDRTKAMYLVGQTFGELVGCNVPINEKILQVDFDVEIDSDMKDSEVNFWVLI